MRLSLGFFLCLACAPGAFANIIGTFVFTATPGYADYTTAFDGSKITVGYLTYPYVGRIYTLVDWSMIDSDAPAGFQNLNVENSAAQWTITDGEPTGWVGSFTVTSASTDPFEDFLASSSGLGGPGFIGAVNDNGQDGVIGTWTFEPVPDSTSTLYLTLMAVVALFAARQFYMQRADLRSSPVRASL
jgi:hypothetical protein